MKFRCIGFLCFLLFFAHCFCMQRKFKFDTFGLSGSDHVSDVTNWRFEVKYYQAQYLHTYFFFASRQTLNCNSTTFLEFYYSIKNINIEKKAFDIMITNWIMYVVFLLVVSNTSSFITIVFVTYFGKSSGNDIVWKFCVAQTLWFFVYIANSVFIQQNVIKLHIISRVLLIGPKKCLDQHISASALICLISQARSKTQF
jgi:hypothetical protein